jgi:uncharacterized protein (UPF0335 family)
MEDARGRGFDASVIEKDLDALKKEHDALVAQLTATTAKE